ncbi:Glycosyltransferase involved in cell wall bisynthesis [Lysinibacillus sp. AC-3]|nr:Glycosyltransferase involved in cell wall bisynthesis [Lysinibacillus sp. AC-3]
MSLPLISVVIPAYNRAKTIKYCLDSITSQTYKNIEIIVVDDGSQDNTVDIVKSYNDSRVKCIITSGNRGAQAARNSGIKNSIGEWIAFQDSDDEWLPNKLSKQIERALNIQAEVVYCECYVKKEDELGLFGTKGFEGNIYNKLLFNQDPTFPGIVVKKECLESIEYLDENVPSYQEWDTSIQLAKKFKFAYCSEPLFIYHLHEGETISKNIKRGFDGMKYIVNKYADEMELYGGASLMHHYYSYLLKGYEELGEDVEVLKKIVSNYNFLEMEKFNTCKEVCIFGAGSTGKECLEILKKNGKEVLFFIDNNYKYGEFEGLPVYSVDYLKQAEVGSIILASLGHVQSMRKQLLDLDIKSNVIDYNLIKIE